VLFILLLPFDTPRWLLLLSGFLLGFVVDIFSHPLGLHAAATVFMAFLRPYVINIISAEDEFDPGLQPGLRDMGFTWFASYAVILVLMHHMIYFYLEIFRINEIATTLLRILLSTAVTVMLIILSLYIFSKRR
jgi:rod shape-determining protein MreD